MPGFQMNPGQVVPRQPALPPVIGDQPSVNPKLGVAGAPHAEEMFASRLRLNFTFPAHADIAEVGKGGMDAR